MKKLFLFAIGGTGERVLRSTTMLLAAGVPAFNGYDIYPIIIDYDAANKDKDRTRDILKQYQKINRIAYANHPLSSMPQDDQNMGQFFGCTMKEMNGLNDFVLDFNPGKTNLTFRNKIGFDQMKGNLLPTHSLIESLYDTSDEPTTELNLDLTVGFKGNPNIGSVIFHKLSDYNEYDAFVSTYNADQEDKVVIIGSLFGGTGASGIPVLAQQIKKDIPNVDMAALMIQPYFAPEIVKGGAINAKLFDSKTKAALNFYERSGIKNSMRAVYHIGDPYPTIIKYCEGGAGQQNNANPVEFISALAIAHYCGDMVPTGTFGNEYMYGLSRDIVSKVDKTGKQDSCRLFADDFDQQTKDNVLKYLTAFAYALKYHHTDVVGDKLKKEKTFLAILDYENIKSDVQNHKLSVNGKNKLQDLLIYLNDYVEVFTRWLSELDYEGDDNLHIQPNSHRLAFFDFGKEISDMIEKPQEKAKESKLSWSKVGNFIGGGSSNVNITPLMSSNLKDRKHLDETGKKMNTKEKEFVFMDILRASCLEIVNKK